MQSTDSAQLWKLNHRLLTRVMNAAAPQFDDLGIETKEFFVLDEVDNCKHPAELAAQLMLPKASVTVYLRALVAKGLVTREIDETDLRRHRLSTTTEGRLVLERALAALAKEFGAMMDKLDEQDRADFRRILLSIVTND
ncbi:MarR family transcriptional regulator [Rhodococcus sp. 15-725-2-2b]|jgi:DNA-binding MarR family transcriptional regulator|uniref:MarR family winged helix-turn-helix transcriptional regulator n=1 Tax=unclassified Rhodococcus (in: high G+C Gram-positive bacteria) TaxID=192944 RepID=UPI000B9C0F3A|nr:MULTISPECIES: MarR family transcriptional regulator [unclassified Rhodococcus (in: high G+C Gram-positive bacteria)]OZC65639.1 MarR family transcriptional regulator [Rhodococcus sp. 06-470-2]OZC69474.1 MarR family transcriptional regulator [Rhodococcus sp. 06-469-3-2]OZC85679.1 MarR family transcriptional regulator [Rhodococcus sp. 06-418-5]OZD45515.1 MarR family transcriptional regulator [Rhodococcus sp. 06-1477-1A]OZE12204.1 MarR family transcriptional regulator [Rhodococcus sp. 05-2255-3